MKKLLCTLIVLISISFFLIATGFSIYHHGLINAAQLGYAGSIIGGSLTLGGVWWTISEQKEELRLQQEYIDLQRQNDLAIQYKPIFSLEFSHSLVYNFPADNTAISFYLIFNNVGRGEATNITAEYSRSIPPYAFMVSYDDNQIIVQKNSCYLMISISKAGKQLGENSYEIAPFDQNDKMELPISIKFNDSFENQYVYYYTISFAFQTKIDSQKIKSITLKDGKSVLEMKDPNKKISEPCWIATISKPKIEYISKHNKKS